MATPVDQLDDIEQQLSRIGRQVAGLRAELAGDDVRTTTATSTVAADAFQPLQQPIVVPSRRPPAIPGLPADPPVPLRAPARPVDDRPLLDRLGPQAFAWAGGIAMLLGIVFVFVLAVRRGWVDEELRVLLGLGVSLGLMGVALRLRAKLADSPAPVACAAVAIGGLFTTLVAATRIYGFVPVPAGIILAQAIGALAVACAIRWKTEIIAGLGLVGAMFAAPLVGAAANSPGLALVAIAYVAVAVVALTNRWRWTMVAATWVITPQAFGLIVAESGDRTGGTLSALALVVATALATAVLWQLRDDVAIAHVTVSSTIASLGVGVVAALDLFTTDLTRGAALGVVSLAHLGAATVLWRRSAQIATALIGGAALAVGAGAISLVLDGLWRVAALGGLAVALAALAKGVSDRRIFAASGAGLFLTAVFAMSEAPPFALFERGQVPGIAAIGLVLLALAAAAIAWLGRDEEWQPIAAWTALTTGLLAISAVIIGAIVAGASPAGLDTAFQRAHMAVSLVWAVIGLALLWQGIRRSSRAIRHGGTVLLIAAMAKLFVFDLANLEAMARALSFLVVGAIVLTGAVIVGRVTTEEADEQPSDALAV